jgi:hypothetical protein
VPRKEPDVLTVARQMREAIGYLAIVASKSELDKIARTLLGLHLDLGAKIDALIQEENAARLDDADAPQRDSRLGLIRH